MQHGVLWVELSLELNQRTNDGKVIVKDELLTFVVVKMRTLSHDETVLLVTHSFNSEQIESSKKILFEVCPNTCQGCVSHKGAQMDINNVKNEKMLNECREDISRFVSLYLDDFSPVSFNHIDVPALLGRMEQINTDICCVKTSLETQTHAYKSFGQ